MATDRWMEIGGLRFHYRDWGGSGAPVVLLHGLASTCHIWDLVAPILSNDFAVVALDQRGHGESDKPDHGYDFASVSGDLHGFIEGLNLEKPVIAGHSWGGDVALEYAVARPDVARGLCFVDGGTIEVSAGPDMTLERAKEQMAPPDFTGVTVEQLKERFQSWRGGVPATPELAAIRMSNFEVRDDNTVRARLSRENHMRLIEAFWEHRPSLLYSLVKCPVLLMPARRADTDPETARRFRREESIAVASRELPRSETVWLEDSIHDVPLQRPELVAAVIREHIQSGFFG
jgi:pimeloyl-ACP methyl ester carboxylesterase